MRFLVASLVIASAAALSPLACTVAPATEEGGTARFNPTAPTLPEEGDACAPVGDAGSGHAWSDLYRDYFRPTAVSGCAGAMGQCHGAPGALGAAASDYVCADDAAACFASITSENAALVMASDKANPVNSALYAVLRKACGGGSMPKQPASFTFSAADMQRIAAWIAEGAPND